MPAMMPACKVLVADGGDVIIGNPFKAIAGVVWLVPVSVRVPTSAWKDVDPIVKTLTPPEALDATSNSPVGYWTSEVMYV